MIYRTNPITDYFVNVPSGSFPEIFGIKYDPPTSFNYIDLSGYLSRIEFLYKQIVSLQYIGQNIFTA